MSTQTFSPFEREAIWLAHSKKCVYTSELIDINNFHIDHIIPEKLCNQPDELIRVKKKFGLSHEFNLNGYENILPCRPDANLKKGQLIFDPSQMHFFLAIASNKKTLIAKHLETIKNRNIRGKTLILLQQCLERGDLTAEDVVKIIEENNNNPEEIFKLIELMKFADATEIQALAKSEINELREKQICLGLNHHIKGVTLTNDNEDTLFVQNCKDYDSAINNGYFALTNFDIKMSVFFEQQCGLLSSLQNAKVPEVSFINDPKVSAMDLDLLPFSIFPYTGECLDEIDELNTYQNKIDDGTLTIRNLKQNILRIEETEGGMGQLLIEVARADFNGNGIEDILLFQSCYSTEGTLGYGGILILSRKSGNSLFE